MLHATFGTLRQILLDLGFTVRSTPKFVRFDHPEMKTWFLFQPYKDGDDVEPVDLAAVRKTLDERGHLERKLFEERLAARPVAG
jgi:hypothetical protein